MNLWSVLLILIFTYVALRIFSGAIKALVTIVLLIALAVTLIWVGIDNIEKFPSRVEFGNEYSFNLGTLTEKLLGWRVGKDQLLEVARETGWWLPKDFALTFPAGPFFKPAPVIVEGAEGEYALPPSQPTSTGVPPSNLPPTPTLAPAEPPSLIPSAVKIPIGFNLDFNEAALNYFNQIAATCPNCVASIIFNPNNQRTVADFVNFAARVQTGVVMARTLSIDAVTDNQQVLDSIDALGFNVEGQGNENTAVQDSIAFCQMATEKSLTCMIGPDLNINEKFGAEIAQKAQPKIMVVQLQRILRDQGESVAIDVGTRFPDLIHSGNSKVEVWVQIASDAPIESNVRVIETVKNKIDGVFIWHQGGIASLQELVNALRDAGLIL